MTRGTRRALLAGLVCFATFIAGSGCRVHLSQVRENNRIEDSDFDAIDLGRDRRSDVLNALGPPDTAFYGPSVLVFDYLWQRHRATDSRFFIPSEAIPGLDGLFLLSIPRYFFDESQQPDEFRPTLAERLGQAFTRLFTLFVPFTNGQDLVTLSGHQLRHDRLRIVFDRERLVVLGKSLRSASGEYRDESLTSRLLLRAD